MVASGGHKKVQIVLCDIYALQRLHLTNFAGEAVRLQATLADNVGRHVVDTVNTIPRRRARYTVHKRRTRSYRSYLYEISGGDAVELCYVYACT